jgi:hypothetical protein
MMAIKPFYHAIHRPLVGRPTMLSLISQAALAFSSLPPEPTCPGLPVPSFNVSAKFNGCGAEYKPSTYGVYARARKALLATTPSTRAALLTKFSPARAPPY